MIATCVDTTARLGMELILTCPISTSQANHTNPGCLEGEYLIRSKMARHPSLPGKWNCLVCGHTAKSTNLYYHIESQHFNVSSYSCGICGKTYKSRNSYNVHMSTYHRDANKQ